RQGPPAAIRSSFLFGVEGQIPVALEGRGSWDGAPALTLAAVHWNGRQLLAEPITLRLPKQGPQADLQLAFDRLGRQSIDSVLEALGRGALLPEGFDLELQRVHVALGIEPEMHLALRVAALDVTGKGMTLPLTAVELSVSGSRQRWHGQGAFGIAADSPVSLTMEGEGPALAGTVQGMLRDPGRLKVRLAGGKPLPLAGEVDWMADFNWQDGRLELDGNWSGKPLEARETGDAVVRLNRLAGDFQIDGEPSELSFKVGVKLDGAATAQLNLGGRGLEWRLQSTPIDRLAGLFQPRTATIPASLSGSVSGRGRLRRKPDGGWQGPLTLAGARWQTGALELASPRLSATLNLEPGLVALNKFSLEGTPAGYGIGTAGLSLSGTGRWKDGRLELAISGLKVRGAEYLSPDGLAGATGGHAEVRGRLSWTPGAALTADLQGNLGVKEVLAGSFYGDFAALPVTLDGTGRWQPSEQRLALEQATLSVPGIGRLEGRGSWHAGAWEARGDLRIPDLTEVSAGPLQGVFGMFSQALAGVRLEGGLGLAFGGDLDPGGWRLQGELRPDSLGLELP
ncbi:MAG TPA: hypothetical protein VKA48_05205, partial [Gammaproteobacteria bacterium]|nr:hypothetical protein [Gammaproteobacteria bacterium]